MSDQPDMIELVPNTWSGQLEALLVGIEAGGKARSLARAELRKIAKAADCYLRQAQPKKQCMATFRAQVWIGDNASDFDENTREFDVADQLESMGQEAALTIEDHTYEADALWLNATDKPDAWFLCNGSWAGPYEVEAESAIREYFGVTDA